MNTHSFPLIWFWTGFVILLVPSLKHWHMLIIYLYNCVGFLKHLENYNFESSQQVFTSLGDYSTQNCEGWSPEHSTLEHMTLSRMIEKVIKRHFWHRIWELFFPEDSFHSYKPLFMFLIFAVTQQLVLNYTYLLPLSIIPQSKSHYTLSF